MSAAPAKKRKASELSELEKLLEPRYRPPYDKPPRYPDNRFIWQNVEPNYGPLSKDRPLCIGREQPLGGYEVEPRDVRQLREARPSFVASGNEAGKGASDGAANKLANLESVDSSLED